MQKQKNCSHFQRVSRQLLMPLDVGNPRSPPSNRTNKAGKNVLQNYTPQNHTSTYKNVFTISPPRPLPPSKKSNSSGLRETLSPGRIPPSSEGLRPSDVPIQDCFGKTKLKSSGSRCCHPLWRSPIAHASDWSTLSVTASGSYCEKLKLTRKLKQWPIRAVGLSL